jgi:hypothetical protein
MRDNVPASVEELPPSWLTTAPSRPGVPRRASRRGHEIDRLRSDRQHLPGPEIHRLLTAEGGLAAGDIEGAFAAADDVNHIAPERLLIRQRAAPNQRQGFRRHC